MKISFFRIVEEHLKTFKGNNGTGWDFVFFLLIPIGGAIFLVCNSVFVSMYFVNVIVSALSIFVGLLFNIIVILFDIVKTEKVRELKRELVKELITNISFCILLSLFAIIFSLITQIKRYSILVQISNCITYILALEFLITLFMILKRMYAVFINEINELAKAEQQEHA